jgi:histone acetyltransferase
MNHVKDWVRTAHPGIKHFLTYADNYAFGYFKKQGFTKEVTLPRHLWAGYIKDYEGATIMQCSMLPRIKYLDAGILLLKQKQLILQKIREHSNSHIVHSGRALFGDRTRVDPSEVEALRKYRILCRPVSSLKAY